MIKFFFILFFYKYNYAAHRRALAIGFEVSSMGRSVALGVAVEGVKNGQPCVCWSACKRSRHCHHITLIPSCVGNKMPNGGRNGNGWAALFEYQPCCIAALMRLCNEYTPHLNCLCAGTAGFQSRSPKWTGCADYNGQSGLIRMRGWPKLSCMRSLQWPLTILDWSI